MAKAVWPFLTATTDTAVPRIESSVGAWPSAFFSNRTDDSDPHQDPDSDFQREFSLAAAAAWAVPVSVRVRGVLWQRQVTYVVA